MKLSEIQQHFYINFHKTLTRLKRFWRFKKQIMCFQMHFFIILFLQTLAGLLMNT